MSEKIADEKTLGAKGDGKADDAAAGGPVSRGSSPGGKTASAAICGFI